MPSTTIVTPSRPLFDEARIAVAGFLARYPETTRRSYASDLRQYFAWCESVGLRAFEVQRAHLELWARAMEEKGLAPSTIRRRLSTVAGFYAIAVVDGVLEHSPAEHVRRSKVDAESTTLGLDRTELSAFIAQGSAGSPTDHALACLLGLLGAANLRGLLAQHRGPGRRTRPSDDPLRRQGLQARPDAPAAPGGEDPGPRRRRAQLRPAPAHPGREPDEPPRRHPDRAAAGQRGGDHQAHLAALAAPQLHHCGPRRRGGPPRRPDRRPSRRSEDDHPL